MIALANDHAGFELKEVIKQMLDENNIQYKDFGAPAQKRAEYPIYALALCNAVASGECEKGILICGTGVGMSLAANKVKGIRCVVCSETYSAKMSRLHNDTNVLAIGARVLGTDVAKEVVSTWIETEFEGGRHAERVQMITDIEQKGTLE